MTYLAASFCCLIALLSSCASLHDKVFKEIHEGDTDSHVLEVLGQPSFFEPSRRIAGAQGWYYDEGADRCGFTIDHAEVKYIFCGANPNYVGPGYFFGSVLQGMGQGLQNGAKNQTNCVTTGSPGYYTTSCY